MPEYENSAGTRAIPERARDHGLRIGHGGSRSADEYVRTTVVLATVLFLLALSFLIPGPDRSRSCGALMTYGLIAIALYPRF